MLIMGKMGPKISSCMTGSEAWTSVNMVGAMYLSDASVSPPIAIFPLLKNFDKRLKNSVSIYINRILSLK